MAAERSSSSSACFRLLPISSSLQGAWEVTRVTRLRAPRRDGTNTPVNASLAWQESKRSSHLEAMGQVAAKATWTMGRTGKSTVRVQV